MTESLFWIFTGLILYTYFGYTLLLLVISLVTFRLWRKDRSSWAEEELPEVTLLIAAYNEIDVVEEKIANTRALNYPSSRLHVLWITDGSDDGTPEKLNEFPDVKVLHETQRAGKTAALNRAMQAVKTPYTIFCDANTVLDREAIRRLVGPFRDARIGCVAGEKRILKNLSDTAAGSGEGAYWQYEAVIKSLESKCYSALAAAGELYAIRTDLFKPVAQDVIIDDFFISMQIAMAGYKIRYVPQAFASESASANIREELKRKIRIASGGFQAIARMPHLLNVFRFGFLSFEFISHKLLRWAVVPIALIAVLFLNILLVIESGNTPGIYHYILMLQGFFYLMVLAGLLFERKTTRLKIFFLPYYLIIINYAQLAGLIRFLSKKQSAAWEKAKRS